MDAKLSRIRLNKVDGIIKINDGISYLESSNSYNVVYYRINSRIYDAIFDRINYFINKKSDITDSINHNFARIRIDTIILYLLKKKDCNTQYVSFS